MSSSSPTKVKQNVKGTVCVPETISNICYWRFVYTFSRWIKAFPIQTEKAQKVPRCLLKKIIPRYRIPVSIRSDNGLAFVTEVVQLMAKKLKIS
jgi:hypothetical protein